ncbi:ClpP/crotonase-like domain-containing protein [Thamnocephalis sphaerospora]|uniref:ClpP/crotonase-like domain-containing protein n=1 Tax=Thamnocephalis sphaerospora TaxID=78915 RepID=A0A4P9XTS4_9FUNG|nr:ClpP/crotonase-like domain-containing protein [Thamnocephalis sphaerospora]|eukprot:RKP09594.1 ClpP/crotonase-like domain-containing protein [Thamnocephalis sphaerospora]
MTAQRAQATHHPGLLFLARHSRFTTWTEMLPAASSTPSVLVETANRITIITINRPEKRNCVDRPTADALSAAFRHFDQDAQADVAILTGAGGNFCAGADLSALVSGDRTNRVSTNMDDDGPMGPTRMRLSKPVIAAVSGYAVAGGLELACWCDLRVVDRTAVFGVFCRRRGVPLIDGGTIRLPRLIGESAALDLILTGRDVAAEEAMQLHLANRMSSTTALDEAVRLAQLLCSHPQTCMRGDLQSVHAAADAPDMKSALQTEMAYGLLALESDEFRSPTNRFLHQGNANKSKL